jgi:hypothetical protein
MTVQKFNSLYIDNRKYFYTTLSSQILQRKDISIEARGTWAYLSSLPENWNIHTINLRKELNIGRDKVLRIINELIDHRLCKRIEVKDEKSKKFERFDYHIYAEPYDLCDPVPEIAVLAAVPDPVPEIAVLDFVSEMPVPEIAVLDFGSEVSPAAYNIHKQKKENININNNKEESQNSPRPPSLSIFNEKAKELTEFLINSIISWKGGVLKGSDSPKWLMHMEHILRLDKRTEQEIRELITWMTLGVGGNSLFWRSNIYSTLGLREKFDAAQASMKSEFKGKSNQKSECAAFKHDKDYDFYAAVKPDFSGE